jgi:purine-binding chemotaxis protein CheW
MIMDRKKKLETSLEGLFSKSKGTQEPAEVEKKVGTSVADADNKPKKSTPVVKKTGTSPVADKKAKKKPEKSDVKVQKDVKVEKMDNYPKPMAEAVAQKVEMPVSIPVETVKAPPLPEPAVSEVVPMAMSENKPAPAEKKADLALAAVSNTELAVADEEKVDTQLLVFEIEQVQYAIDVSFVQTIIKPQPVFLVPGTADYLKGLINLRGEVVPVIDLRTRFDLPTQEITKDTRFVVVRTNDITASMVVDKVHGVETIAINLIEKPSGLVMHVDNRYLTGMARYEGQIILILNLMHTIKPDLVEQR